MGRSNATDNPVWPCSSRYLNLSLVSLAVEYPEYWRIVQSRPLYILGWTPLVYGYSPGKPRFSMYEAEVWSESSTEYTASISNPLSVVKWSDDSPKRSMDGFSVFCSQSFLFCAIIYHAVDVLDDLLLYLQYLWTLNPKWHGSKYYE